MLPSGRDGELICVQRGMSLNEVAAGLIIKGPQIVLEIAHSLEDYGSGLDES